MFGAEAEAEALALADGFTRAEAEAEAFTRAEAPFFLALLAEAAGGARALAALLARSNRPSTSRPSSLPTGAAAAAEATGEAEETALTDLAEATGGEA